MGAFPFSHLTVHRPPRLITELIALAQEWGWSVQDLARELGIHRTTLVHQRVGRHALKTAMLARIARRFRNDRTVRDLIWHYLTVEYEEGAQSAALPPLPRVPDAVAGSLRAYIARFSEESVHGGRGLYLASTDAPLLSATLQWLQRAFTQHRIDPCLLRADRPVSAAETRFALAAPVLLLERVDFMKEPVAEVVRRRADLVRPMVVTSMKHPDTLADPYMRRVLTSMTRLLEIGPPPSSLLPTTNGPVPAESEQQ
jgi:AcrR family transcriptional regulator